MIDARCDKTGRCSVKTLAGYAANPTQTIGIFEETGRILRWTNRRFVRTVNNRDRMNGTGPVPNDSSRIGNTCGTMAEMSAKIGVISVPIVRIADRIDAGPERINWKDITIDKSYEPIIEGLEARLHIRVGALDKAGAAVLRTIGLDSGGRLVSHRHPSHPSIQYLSLVSHFLTGSSHRIS